MVESVSDEERRVIEALNRAGVVENSDEKGGLTESLDVSGDKIGGVVTEDLVDVTNAPRAIPVEEDIGQIDWQEMMAGIRSVFEKGVPVEALEQGVRTAFSAFDRNGDDIINGKELAEAFEGGLRVIKGQGIITPEEARKMENELDAIRGSKKTVSIDEVVAMVRKADTDKDGKIDLQEMNSFDGKGAVNPNEIVNEKPDKDIDSLVI